MSHYQEWVLRDFENSAAKHLIGIDDYVGMVVENMASVKHKDEIYEPITFHVLMRGYDEAVPVQTDFSSGWYERLQQGVAEMMGTKNAKQLQFRDMVGEDISGRSAHELSAVGKLRVFDKTTGKRLQLEPGARVIPEVPGHMSNNKMHRISEWFDGKLREDAIHAVASELKGSSAAVDLQTRTQANSNLEKKLVDLLKPELQHHLQRHGSNERAKKSDANAVAQQMARAMMKNVRTELRGNMQRIKKHMAAKAVTAMGDSVEDEPLFDAAATQGVAAGLQNESQLYGKMARRAITKSKMDMINHVYRANSIDCGCGDNKKKDDDEYYENYYYGQDLYSKYQLYSGRAVHMEIDSGATAPVAQAPQLRGARLRKKQYQEEQKQIAQEAKFVPFKKTIGAGANRFLERESQRSIGAELDELVPIQKPIGAELDELVPIQKSSGANKFLDELVPIRGWDPDKPTPDWKFPEDQDKKDEEDEEDNIPTNGIKSKMVPIQKSIGADGFLDELVPINKKGVLPIASDLPDFAPRNVKLDERQQQPHLIEVETATRNPKLVHVSELVGARNKPKLVPKERVTKDSDRINDGMPDIYDFM